MTERKKGKKKKGQAVVSLLRMVLLLGCCRGGTSERVEDRDKILHDRNRTRTLKIKKKPKKGLFRKSGAEKSGRDNDTDMQFQVIEEIGEDTSGEHENTGMQSQVWEENGQDSCGQHEDTDVQTQVYKGNGQDVTDPNDDTVQTVVTGLSSSPPSQTSTNGHKGASISSVENRKERHRTITVTAEVHPIPGPSNHDDLHSTARLLESLEIRVHDLNKTLVREQRQDKGQNPAVTPDLRKPRPGPSHTNTPMLPTRTESSGSGKLTEEDDASDGHLLVFSLFIILSCFVFLYNLYVCLNTFSTEPALKTHLSRRTSLQ